MKCFYCNQEEEIIKLKKELKDMKDAFFKEVIYQDTLRSSCQMNECEYLDEIRTENACQMCKKFGISKKCYNCCHATDLVCNYEEITIE